MNSEDLFYLDLLTEDGWMPSRGDKGWYIGERAEIPIDQLTVQDCDYLGGLIRVSTAIGNQIEWNWWDIHPEDFTYEEPEEPTDQYLYGIMNT